jgi:hypothetical protein
VLNEGMTPAIAKTGGEWRGRAKADLEQVVSFRAER